MACVTGEFYHIVNKGVEGRKIFTSSSEYLRFKKGLLLFNANIPINFRDVSEQRFEKQLRQGSIVRFVDIIAYCLLDNHFHLFVRQNVDDGIEQFLRKLVGGYTKYFNLKHKRTGVLFQSVTKIIHVSEESYFTYIPQYIALNSLDKCDIKWREHGVNVKEINNARKALLAYPYSSLQGTIGITNDPILSFGLVRETIDTEQFLEELLSWSSADYNDVRSFIDE